jgi:hypothetical protein
VRFTLGAEEFGKAVEEGAAMTHDEIVPYFLDEIDRLTQEEPSGSGR